MLTRTAIASLTFFLLMVTGAMHARADDNNGTTPFLPGEEWRVHDSKRPLPPVVKAPGGAGNEFAAPPSDAIVLFGEEGTLSAWKPQNEGGQLWPVRDGVLMTNASGDRAPEGANVGWIETRESFGDVQLHLEFRVPPTSTGASGQQYGNSGVYFMGKYEIQVLNSYENATYADGSAASIYGWKPPLVNASRPPGHWQSYDIMFEAPVFSEAGDLVEPAYVTMLHNDVLVHNRQRMLGETIWRDIAQYKVHAQQLPFALQHHGETVHFRNIWMRRLSD